MKSILRTVCEEIAPTPGADLTSQLWFVSKTTIKVYVRKGWLKRDNGKLVLTEKGFREVI
jgi:hypothetical protein